MQVISKLADAATAKLSRDIDALSTMGTADLRAELSRALRLTVEHLVYVAAIWKELESRGQDLSELRRGIGAYVAAIASGAVAPEVVVAFAEQPGTLRKVAALSIDRQKAIAAGAPIPVVEKRTQPQRTNAKVVDRGPEVPPLAAMAAAGTPADVVSLCMQLIRASMDPSEVAKRLAVELEQMPQPKKTLTPREREERDKRFEQLRHKGRAG